MPKRRFVAAILMVFVTTLPAYSGDPALKCEAGKLKEAGKYGACRLSAESKAVKTGTTPDYSKCVEKFTPKWQLLESNAGAGVCPSEGDIGDISSFIDACDQAITDALAGGTLLEDVIACNDDLAACNADLSSCDGELADCGTDLDTCNADLAACNATCAAPPARPLKTGQTYCFDGGGAAIPCAGTGQDGELQKGVARSFTDNGDGTITDNATGLMWEKLSDDGSIHDYDNTYTWSNAFASKVATLNSSSFAGHNDWRVPNLNELATLRSLEFSPPFTYSAFSTGCTAGCTVLTCSCTNLTWSYWSTSTYTYGFNTYQAWTVNFLVGSSAGVDGKGNSIHVRAVRDGL